MVKNGDNDNFQHPPSQSPPLWFFSSCLDSIQPNLQREANCGHLTIWSRGLGIKSFPAQSEVPILLTASGKRHPGINPLPKYTVGAKDVAVTGGSRAVRIVICQGCSCERHRCREQNSLWASNWQGITWFSRARGAEGDWGCSTSQCHPGLKDHEASWGPERPKATYSVFCQRAASLRHCFHEKVNVETFLQNSDFACFPNGVTFSPASQGCLSTASPWHKEHLHL